MSDTPTSPSPATVRRKAQRAKAHTLNLPLDGAKLKAARVDAGMSIPELAAALARDRGPSVGKLKRVIRDVEFSPTYERRLRPPTAKHWAAVLGVEVEAIIRPPETVEPEPVADDGQRHLHPRLREARA